MKSIRPTSTVIIALFSFLISDAFARTWTTQSGQTLEAEFVRMMGDKVYLKANDGSGQRSVPFNILSEKDKKVVRELSGSSAPRKLGERKFGERPKFGERTAPQQKGRPEPQSHACD